MTVAATQLFYSYAHEDEGLKDQLDQHLSLLQRQGLLTSWHAQDISPGSLRSFQLEYATYANTRYPGIGIPFYL